MEDGRLQSGRSGGKDVCGGTEKGIGHPQASWVESRAALQEL